MKVKLIYVLVICTSIFLSVGIFLYAKEKGGLPWNNKEQEKQDGSLSVDALETDSTSYQLTNDDPLIEIKQIAEAYTKDHFFSFRSITYAYKNNEKTAVDQASAFYIRNDSIQYFRQASQEYIIEDRSALVIDHQLKVMNKMPVAKENAAKNQMIQFKTIEDYLQQEGSAATVAQSGTQKIITITNENHPSVQQYIIRYTPENHLLSEIKMLMVIVQDIEGDEMAGKQLPGKSEADTTVTLKDLGMEQAAYKVIIRYTDYSNTLKLKDDQLIQHFIEEKAGKMQPTSFFADYELNY